MKLLCLESWGEIFHFVSGTIKRWTNVYHIVKEIKDFKRYFERKRMDRKFKAGLKSTVSVAKCSFLEAIML